MESISQNHSICLKIEIKKRIKKIIEKKIRVKKNRTEETIITKAKIEIVIVKRTRAKNHVEIKLKNSYKKS